MKPQLERVVEGQRAIRRALAVRPISETLRMLDALREREITLRGGAPRPTSCSEARLRITPVTHR